MKPSVPEVGTVYLTGAGCGDSALITVKALKILREADAVVYDALMNDALLRQARPDAEKIYVGKRAGNHALSQQEINELLVKLALDGKRVVRLKGGDPYVFGRGGEEGEALYNSHIPFEVIPGVTSAIGGLAYAGIPVTHRDCSQAFAVITGHTQADGRAPDWKTLAAFDGTLVFLMGVKNIEEITKALIRHGKNPATPSALVCRAGTPEQRTLTAPLSELSAAARRGDFRAPGLIAIGEVVKKRDALNFFEHKPLFGKRILVTRAKAQASAFSDKLRALGAEPVEYAAIKICENPEVTAPFTRELERIGTYTHLVFTSVNGVELFMRVLYNTGRDVRALSGLHISAIGEATAQKLMGYGLKADLVPKRFIAEDLIEHLRPLLTPQSRVLLPRAGGARPLLKEELSKICPVHEYPVYTAVPDCENTEKVKKLLAAGTLDAVTFTSSSTVKNCVEALGAAWLKKVAVYSIGPQTSRTLRQCGIEPAAEARTYTLDGLIEVLSENTNRKRREDASDTLT